MVFLSNKVCFLRSGLFAIVALAVLLVAFASGGAQAGDHGDALPGPIPAQVQRVIDGDTLEVSARVWLGQVLTVRVRLSGVDAPEMKSRCSLARRAAHRAKTYLTNLVGGQAVRLTRVRHDKYAGRVLAHVVLRGDVNVADRLLRDRMVWPYRPGFRHKRADCQDIPLRELEPERFGAKTR